MAQRLRAASSEQPLGEMFGELADHFKAWISAELAVIKAQIENNTRKLAAALVLLILSAVIALAGIVVLAHTLVLVLAPYFGAPLAGASIGGFLLVLAAAFLLYARSLTDLTNLVPGRLRRAFGSQKASGS